MISDEAVLGRCPDCGEQIPDGWLLIEYKKGDGTESMWAECPAYEQVVAPE